MAQETNLNVSPYFDDFDKTKGYHKVLFKPGYPVQARELTTLQTILQNQVEQFGTHFFKEGAKVIPGDLTYLNNFHAVEIESEFLGLPVSLYLNELIGKKITGETSGVVAKIITVIPAIQSTRNSNTLYVDYQLTGTEFSQTAFNSNENLLINDTLNFGINSFIPSGEGFARTKANATSTGSAFRLGSGVYFIRGYFVNVEEQLLLLDQYTNTPSYRVGLEIVEEIINSDVDSSLTDNANGFNNYAAPGADRFRISAILAKNPLNSQTETPNFIELASVTNGILRKINTNTTYNIIGDELARRTFDESGDYYVRPFNVFCKETLNDGKGNEGLFYEQTSYLESVNEDTIAYKVTPGKAYVKGYEVDVISPTILTAAKPRTTKTFEDFSVNFNYGSTFTLNRVYGSPSVGFNTSYTVSLRDQRIGINSESSSGKEIGLARVYDFALESGSYNTAYPQLNEWDISLYDIQTYGNLNINAPISLNQSTYIKGESSGATAFLKSSISSGIGLTVYQISGTFINGEKLTFDKSTETRVSVGFTEYKLSDVKSIYGIVGTAKTFNADVVQKISYKLGNATISAASAGISTITVPTTAFSGIVTTGNIVQYTRSNFSVKSIAKVEQVYTNYFTISGLTTVANIYDGALPASQIDVNDLAILGSSLQSTGESSNNLVTILPKANVQSVDLSNSDLIIRKQFDVSITNNSTGPITASTNERFLPFDEERYVLSRSNGVLEELSTDRFQFNTAGNVLTINGLGTNDSNCTLIATLRKASVTEKVKKKVRVDTLIVNKSKYNYSGIGATTANDGLVYGDYPYGTRVQDDKISLNKPDVVEVFGIFASTDTSDPVLPSMTLSNLDGPNTNTDDLIIGEELVGTISGTRARYCEKLSNNKISFTYLNENNFELGEAILFSESGVGGVFSTGTAGSIDVTNNYLYSTGQTLTHYDYSYIERLKNVKEPNRKLKIVFSRSYYESSDSGDITTVNSYTNYDYAKEISATQNIRNSDLIDVRPRVKEYTVVEGAASPFEFSGRSFVSDNHSSKYILASDESTNISFNFYLPRIDRIFLTKEGLLQVKVGSPSENPTLPEEVSGALNVANVSLPAYLFDVGDAQITIVEHKRYQMSDIFRLENRIKNLEYYTTLSLLESSTANLFIDDGEGLNRFKSGFFIDNFSSVSTQDSSVGIKNSIDLKQGQLRPSHYTTNISLQLGSTAILNQQNQTQDLRFITDIVGTGIRKTGSVVTLDYNEELWLSQGYATRTENVTPYFVQLWNGSIKLDPTVDVWIDVNRMNLRDVKMEGSFLGVAEALRADVRTAADGSRLGMTPIIWNSWEVTGIRQDMSMSLNASVTTTVSAPPPAAAPSGGAAASPAAGSRPATPSATTSSPPRSSGRR